LSYEQIWAPWRLGYIVGEARQPEPEAPADLLPGADGQCFLCRAAVGDDDRRHLVISRTNLTITVLNRYPYNNGHLLVAPREHLARLDELSDAQQLEIGRVVARMVGLLEETLSPDGFNAGLNLGRSAGAGLPGHLHWHIVPRWTGDTNFMPALAGIRVIPQSLDALWELLTAKLASR
jgi:ATP adenylyltransferase